MRKPVRWLEPENQGRHLQGRVGRPSRWGQGTSVPPLGTTASCPGCSSPARPRGELGLRAAFSPLPREELPARVPEAQPRERLVCAGLGPLRGPVFRRMECAPGSPASAPGLPGGFNEGVGARRKPLEFRCTGPAAARPPGPRSQCRDTKPPWRQSCLCQWPWGTVPHRGAESRAAEEILKSGKRRLRSASSSPFTGTDGLFSRGWGQGRAVHGARVQPSAPRPVPIWQKGWD